jgi:hypothetical protein
MAFGGETAYAGTMRPDIVPGATFPDYELTDYRGKRRKLSELQGPDPLVLILSRGGFCPKDRLQMEGLLQLHREMEVGYCRLVTISTDSLAETYEFRTGVGAHWRAVRSVAKTAHGFFVSSACAAAQVRVIAAGRFREFPKLRQVARPRTVPRSGPSAFRGLHCWRQFGDVRGGFTKQ